MESSLVFANGAVTGAFSYALASAGRRGSKDYLGGDNEGAAALSADEAEALIARARGSFRKFLLKSDDAGLVGQFDDAEIKFVDSQPMRGRQLVYARAFTEKQLIEVYPAGIAGGYRDMVFLIGHEFRHLQAVNAAMFTNRNSVQFGWDAHPGELDAFAWSARVICQGQGRSSC